MRTFLCLLMSLFFLTGCSLTSTRSVAIEPDNPTVPENLLGECQQAAKIPPGTTARQLAGIIAHDRAALKQCRKDKSALNKAVRKAIE